MKKYVMWIFIFGVLSAYSFTTLAYYHKAQQAIAFAAPQEMSGRASAIGRVIDRLQTRQSTAQAQCDAAQGVIQKISCHKAAVFEAVILILVGHVS